MSRFAPITPSTDQHISLDDSYRYGFSSPTDSYVYKSGKGLSQRVVEEISFQKDEPEWMRKKRLEGYKVFQTRPMPEWGADLSEINFNEIQYYLKPTDREERSWDDVPTEIKQTFEKLGIPEAERKALAGVKVQFDSEVVYGSIKKMLLDKGVVFLGMDEGLRQYPDLVREYFGTLIPAGDNKFAALNTSVWSGGSFVYVPKGVEVGLPLQAYFRINAPNAGQFERTLIIADEGAKVHYIEGCFVKGTRIAKNCEELPIENVKVGDRVLTHQGIYRRVNFVQIRKYSGKICKIKFWGDATTQLQVTGEHPFLTVKRQQRNERNAEWKKEWRRTSELLDGDYLVMPVNRTIISREEGMFEIDEWRGKKTGYIKTRKHVPSTPEFFRLAGYYLAEGSISSNAYLNFSFSNKETGYVNDVKRLMEHVFGIRKSHLNIHEKNHGISLVFNSTELCRVFSYFGRKSYLKKIPEWMVYEDPYKQKELIIGLFRGDGNYFDAVNKHGRKEVFRITTTSEVLARQVRDILLRLGIVSFINRRDRRHEHRLAMYVVGVTGEQTLKFGEIVGRAVDSSMNGKKRATKFGFDGYYAYLPIQKIEEIEVKDIEVFNFGVDSDESYVAEGVAVHNCTAPAFTDGSLHSAVVEIFVKPGATVQYTTIQNWYKNVYNLVTKRARVEEEGRMIWTDFNMGSKRTMKYPSFFLVGKGARGETLSMAMAGPGQHQDTGSKAMHLAPYTSSTIVSKSISRGGGRTSYRGMVSIGPQAHHAKSKVVCDALILDPESRSDTYPTNKIFNSDVTLEHEASVSRIGEEQLFYLMARGIPENEAGKMIVQGFADPLVKKLPLEYAVEMNRLIDLEMSGSVG